MPAIHNFSVTSVVCSPREGAWSLRKILPVLLGLAKTEDSDDDTTAYASQEEAGAAILSVLQERGNFLRGLGIQNMRHRLSSDQRGNLTTHSAICVRCV